MAPPIALLIGVQCFIVLELMIMGPRYHICAILVLVATRVPYLCPLAKVVPFSKIFMDPSDPKHVAKLLKGSGGPGVVNTARTYRWTAFQRSFQTPSIRSGRTSMCSMIF